MHFSLVSAALLSVLCGLRISSLALERELGETIGDGPQVRAFAEIFDSLPCRVSVPEGGHENSTEAARP
jgi:hypothetical protein